MFKVFDLDGHKKINMEEFDSGFTKWLDQTKHALEKQYFSRKSLKDIYQVHNNTPCFLNLFQST